MKKNISIKTIIYISITLSFLFTTCTSNRSSDTQNNKKSSPIRAATFNTALNRNNPGDLIRDLSDSGNKQARAVAEIIQQVNPDIILLNEFDYDEEEKAITLFKINYLSKSFNGSTPIDFPFHFAEESNTGIDSGFDFDNDSQIGGPGDAYGYGMFPGQYGMLILSKYPILKDQVRTFQKFLWKDMPGAYLPKISSSEYYYSDEELEIFRLSSKSHWDVPVKINDYVLHFLACHPTPPVFDGAEDRNGKRNYDEIRFWADYINDTSSDYIYDDRGKKGGLSMNDYFVIAGDFNADPYDGDSFNEAVNQLLQHSKINSDMTPSSQGAIEASRRQGNKNKNHIGDASFDTGDFNDYNPGNLRLDYVLPSIHMTIVNSGVFWPVKSDPNFKLVGDNSFTSSDHRAVWIEIMPE